MNKNDEIKNGVYVEYFKDGLPHKRCIYKSGVRDGLWEMWWSNGQLKARCIYKDDVLVDHCEERLSNGQFVRTTFRGDTVASIKEIKGFTPRDKFIKMNNLNHDGTRKRTPTNKSEQTKGEASRLVTTTTKRVGVKR